ncbi:MAG: Rossmann-like and DUF2520 domain-containing protein [Pseudomonadota bacterium]
MSADADPDVGRMLTLNLVGAGHVGRVLGRRFAASGALLVQDVLTRSMESAREAVAFIGAGTAVASHGALRRADVTMLAVGDDRIVPACQALADAVALDGAIVFHCSGALAAGALAPARLAGARVASVHPVRSFADPEAVARAFDGTFCGVEGDAAALAVLCAALEAAGARPVMIDAQAKTVYHAAAVFASNYLVTLLDTALRAYQAAGIDEAVARQLVQPLVTETVANVLRLGPAQALSGPLARGDLATVARQQEAVERWDGAAGDLYRALVAPTAALAARRRGR